MIVLKSFSLETTIPSSSNFLSSGGSSLTETLVVLNGISLPLSKTAIFPLYSFTQYFFCPFFAKNEKKIEKLKKTAVRKANWKKIKFMSSGNFFGRLLLGGNHGGIFLLFYFSFRRKIKKRTYYTQKYGEHSDNK